MEGIGICWLEEAHLLTKEQWQILEPTLIRNPDYQFWVIFNPKLATDFVYKRFVINPPPNTIVRKINYLENPFLNPQALEVIEHLKQESLEDYNHFYLGEPLDDDNEAIIKRSWIMAAIDAHKKLGIAPSGSKRIGFDVADDGDDACATVKAYGVLTTGIDLWKAKEDEILKSCTRVYRQALDYDNADITYDAIGVGSSCGAKFNELGYKNHNKFFAGGAVANPDQKVDKTDKKSKLTNRDFYANIKAQAWWSVAERLKNTYNAVTQGMVFTGSDMLFIDSDCQYLEQLIEELSTPRKSFDNSGKVMVESKKDLKKRGITSPNVADAFIMAHLQLPQKSGSF
jgi:phage terminase large subunit